MDPTNRSAFATKHVCRDFVTLKRWVDLAEFHCRILDLATLVGNTAYTALFGSRLYNIYTAQISVLERQIVSSVIITAH